MSDPSELIESKAPATALTHTMLDELSIMLDDDERKYGSVEVRKQLRAWIDSQWALLPPRRYTYIISLVEVDGHGVTVREVDSDGPTLATTDLKALEDKLPGLVEALCDVMYDGGSRTHLVLDNDESQKWRYMDIEMECEDCGTRETHKAGDIVDQARQGGIRCVKGGLMVPVDAAAWLFKLMVKGSDK